jgi:Na+-driven multidrug efflux pump
LGRPLLLSLLRKRGLDIPFMILFYALFGVYGIVWATPVADFLAMVISLLFFIPVWKRLIGPP